MEKASVLVPIYKRKDVMNCRAHREMKIIESVLEKRIRALMEVDNMQFDFITGRMTDAFYSEKNAREILGER